MSNTSSPAVPSPASSATHSTTLHNILASPSKTVLDILAVDDREAARLMGVSARTVWALRMSGDLPYRRIGRRCVIAVDAIRAYLAIGGGR